MAQKIKKQKIVEIKDGEYFYEGEKYNIQGRDSQGRDIQRRDSNYIFLGSEDGNSMLVVSASKLHVLGELNSIDLIELLDSLHFFS